MSKNDTLDPRIKKARAFQHYKGDYYIALLWGIHWSENDEHNGEPAVLYLSVTPGPHYGQTNIRREAVFCELVDWPDGVKRPRYRPVYEPTSKTALLAASHAALMREARSSVALDGETQMAVESPKLKDPRPEGSIGHRWERYGSTLECCDCGTKEAQADRHAPCAAYRPLCVCGHGADRHAFPGAGGTKCTECDCTTFRQKVISS